MDYFLTIQGLLFREPVFALILGLVALAWILFTPQIVWRGIKPRWAVVWLAVALFILVSATIHIVSWHLTSMESYVGAMLMEAVGLMSIFLSIWGAGVWYLQQKKVSSSPRTITVH